MAPINENVPTVEMLNNAGVRKSVLPIMKEANSIFKSVSTWLENKPMFIAVYVKFQNISELVHYGTMAMIGTRGSSLARCQKVVLSKI